MSTVDRCLERLAYLDQADHLLNEVRLYSSQRPLSERLAEHRSLLGEARRHLDTARTVGLD